MAVSDKKTYGLQSPIKEGVLEMVSFDLASGTTGVDEKRLPQVMDVTRTGVGAYRLDCPRGFLDGIQLSLTDNTGALYIPDYSSIGTGQITFTRGTTPADPVAGVRVDGFISYRAAGVA